MGDLVAVMQSLGTGLPVFIWHVGITILIWLLGVTVYNYLTPLHKIKLIKEGNVAAALTLGGAGLSLAVPLAFCLAGSVGAWDIIVWSIPLVIFQILIFMVFNRLIDDLPGRVERGEVAVALYIFMVRMSVAALLAAAISA